MTETRRKFLLLTTLPRGLVIQSPYMTGNSVLWRPQHPENQQETLLCILLEVLKSVLDAQKPFMLPNRYDITAYLFVIIVLIAL